MRALAILFLAIGGAVFFLGDIIPALILLGAGSVLLALSMQKKKTSGLGVKPAPKGVVRELAGNEAITVPSWVVLDTETTGLHPETDRIIEIACRKYINGNVTDTLSTLVDPGIRLPSKITQITGLVDSDIKGAPYFSAIAQQVKDFICDFPVVAHNAKFDAEFIITEAARSGVTIGFSYIDTVKLAKDAFPGQQNYKLSTLIQSIGLLDHEQDHRALSDVDATAKLYRLCRERIPARREEAKQEQQRQMRDDKAYHLNQYGMQAETEGNVARAIAYYEDIVSDGAILPNAYMRLAVIYKKQHRWKDVVRVCESALSVLPGHPGKQCQPEEYQKRRAYALSRLAAEGEDINA